MLNKSNLMQAALTIAIIAAAMRVPQARAIILGA